MNAKKLYLGIDAGSVSVNTVLVDEMGALVARDYRRTRGMVIETIRGAVADIHRSLADGAVIAGCGTTGSGRVLAASLVGADLVKNEITAHTAAGLAFNPETRTILEIGGEDSKIIILEGGMPVDFAMNSICAAGTGAFLDQMAGRLGLPIEELGNMALRAGGEAKISGRCTVFAESDMIFKQQTGIPLDDIVKGLCRSMVRNYLNDVGQGKKISGPILFQGGVAANAGIVKAFEEELHAAITIPPNHDVMGAIGIALLTRDHVRGKTATDANYPSAMKSAADIAGNDFRARGFSCSNCANNCEIVAFESGGKALGYLGGRCGRWEGNA